MGKPLPWNKSGKIRVFGKTKIAKCWGFNYLAIFVVVPLGLEPRTP